MAIYSVRRGEEHMLGFSAPTCGSRLITPAQWWKRRSSPALSSQLDTWLSSSSLILFCPPEVSVWASENTGGYLCVHLCVSANLIKALGKKLPETWRWETILPVSLLSLHILQKRYWLYFLLSHISKDVCIVNSHGIYGVSPWSKVQTCAPCIRKDSEALSLGA